MMDFLTFKRFISIDALIVFYYFGAVVLPVATWFLVVWLVRKYSSVRSAYEMGKDTFWQALSPKQKGWLLFFFAMAFLFMELFWRMLFEFLIAYMQIRDALVQSQISVVLPH